MLPIALITGFLGSGKTTYLSYLAARPRTEPLLFLVNEFARVDVDTPRLQQWTPYVTSLPGGSLFCRCLVTDFMRAMHALAEQAGQTEHSFAGLVIEASGLADPTQLPVLLAETRLTAAFELASVTTVVDPASFSKLRSTLPLVLRQIEAAHFILINKSDCFSTDSLNEIERELRALNPTAAIFRTQRAAIELPLFHPQAPSAPRPTPSPPTPDQHRTPTPNGALTILHLPLAAPANLVSLREFFQTHAAEIVRAKGNVNSGDGWLAIDVSATGYTETPCSPLSAQQSVLVLHVPRPAAPSVEAALRCAVQGAGGA